MRILMTTLLIGAALSGTAAAATVTADELPYLNPARCR